MSVDHREEGVRALAALAHPVRLSLVSLVVRAGREGLASGVIAGRAGLSAATTSHHLTLLVEAGLLVPERKGRSVVYRAAQRAIGELMHVLERRIGVDPGSPFATRTTTGPGRRDLWLRLERRSGGRTGSIGWNLDLCPMLRRGAAAPPYRRGRAIAS